MPGARELHRGFEINILNECSREVSETRLVKVAGQILRDLGFKKAVLSILLVGDRKMRELNRKYLKHAWSTDVRSRKARLSRPRSSGKRRARFRPPDSQALLRFSWRYRTLYPTIEGR